MLRLSFYWVFNTLTSTWKCLSYLFCICLACFLIENKTKENQTLGEGQWNPKFNHHQIPKPSERLSLSATAKRSGML